jgi:type II secretory pathway pseudopilin PulG
MSVRRTLRIRLAAIVAVIVVAAAAVGVLALQASAADRQKDAQVSSGLHTIRVAIYSFAKAHEMYVPPPARLSDARLSAYLPSGTSWPVNPFTGRPMRIGTGPGDVRYRLLGGPRTTAYTIDSVGTNGKSVW